MAFNYKQYDDELVFLPLGGSNEIGMNLNLYRYRGKWLMVDCGIGFADDWYPGVDIIVPNLDPILPFKKDIVGLVLTHAHEDHVGAVAYLWPELGCPIFATPFTAAVLGGIGNIPGAMLGGLMLGLVETFGAGYLPILTRGVIGPEYKDIFAFVILILVLVFRPMGILGERVAR